MNKCLKRELKIGYVCVSKIPLIFEVHHHFSIISLFLFHLPHKVLIPFCFNNSANHFFIFQINNNAIINFTFSKLFIFSFMQSKKLDLFVTILLLFFLFFLFLQQHNHFYILGQLFLNTQQSTTQHSQRERDRDNKQLIPTTSAW